MDGSISSQFISALLLISPLLENPLELRITNEMVSRPYIAMTLKLMQQFGLSYTWEERRIRVEHKAYSKPDKAIFVESDWSAASYFYSLLFLAQEGEIRLPHLYPNSIQGDSVCALLFEQMGIHSHYEKQVLVLRKKSVQATSFQFNFVDCPDIAQTLAVCCAAKNIPATLLGLQTLTIKETNRILALKKELEKFGCQLSYTSDSLELNGIFKAGDTRIETYEDHRMAMSFAPLALCGCVIQIEHPAVVEKSFPHFWEELKKTGCICQE